MEKGASTGGLRHFLHLFFIALAIFLAMLLCATLGYRFVRSSGAKDPKDLYHTEKMQTTPVPKEDPFSNTPNPDIASASLPQQNIQIQTDENDYLVLAEDGVVKLYCITPTGEQVFEQTLPIMPDSLLETDRNLLEKGIILESRTALAALLEDYTS